MGEYLKKAYQERDLLKSLAKLNGLISTEDEKLSDKLHDLQLSHNRKIKLLKKIEKIVKLQNIKATYEYEKALWTSLAKQINDELTFCGRLK